MKGLKLIRRLDLAGLIRWFPVDGAPILQLEGVRLRFRWTEPVLRTVGEWTLRYPNPDALENDEWEHAEHENGKHSIMRAFVTLGTGDNQGKGP